MQQFSGRLADALARRLLSWLRRHVEPTSREWLDALIAESEYADGGWQRLRWALGAVPLVWNINMRRRMHDTAHGVARAHFGSAVINIAAVAGGYALVIPATYGAARVLRCSLLFGFRAGGCQEHPFVFGAIALGGAMLGMITALALRARFAAYWWAVFSVFNTVGFVWFLGSGVADAPRYQATQSAMLMAATFGAVLAAFRAFDLHRHRVIAPLTIGTISFAAADALIRLRDAQRASDNVNHYAILISAMLATMVAAVIGRYWSRDSAERTFEIASDRQP